MSIESQELNDGDRSSLPDYDIEQEIIRHRLRKDEVQDKIRYICEHIDKNIEEDKKLHDGLWNDGVSVDYVYDILKKKYGDSS